MDTLWLPRSACGAGCVSVPTGRIAHRLAATVAVLTASLAVLPALVLLSGRARAGLMRGVARGVLRPLGGRGVVRGRPPRTAALLVANHVSWLDPLVLLAIHPARAVAKSEVRAWPVIGALVAASGTIFLDRVRPRA